MIALNDTNVKNFLYSAQKSSQNKFNYKNFSSNLNQKYPSPKKKPFNSNQKSKTKPVNNNNMNNIKNIQLNINDNNSNTYLVNSKNNRKIIFINSGMTDINNNNYAHSKNKKFMRNLSGEQHLKENNNNINNNQLLNQRSSVKKESSFINRIFYIKNNNLFQGGSNNIVNSIKYNENINKSKNAKKNYKEILSKSSFNNGINNNIENNYQILNNNINNSINKNLKSNGNLKNVIQNKTGYKNNINNYNNNKIDNLKKYIRKTEKYFQKKNTNNKNDLYMNNNINNNFIIKGKANSTPIDDINFIFTNPNNNLNNNNKNSQIKNFKNKNYEIKNSLIYEDNDNDNNNTINEKKLNSKKMNKANNSSNNNYIVNVNKYINIINKKNKIINKNNSSNNNGINIYNYNSYKIINNTNNISKTHKKNNLIKHFAPKNNNNNINNYIYSPDGFYTKKYKSINKNGLIPNSKLNYKDEYNSNYNKINFEIILKNNFRNNTHTNPNQNEEDNIQNILGFKKLKTVNFFKKNAKNDDFNYENKISSINLKNQRQRRFDSELKNSIIDSNSFNFFNKNNNTNSSLLRPGNNNSYNNKNNKYNNNHLNSRIYNESFSSSTKNLNSSQRNTLNYNFDINNKIDIKTQNYIYNNLNNNNIPERNTNYKKGRNEKYNLGIIFKPQTIGQKQDYQINRINSNRNPNLKGESKESKTININDKKGIGTKSYVNNNKNMNFIKLMKTVNDYKNKNSKQRYDNYLNIDKNKNVSKNIMNNINNNINEKNIILKNKNKIKSSYNPEIINMNLNTFSEKKVIQNINQNTLTMYSIYIISHYFRDFNKIGLSKIILLNKEKKSIPVICSNNNCNKDSNKLFDIMGNNSKNNTLTKPFIADFKNNIYINFYVNNANNNEIKYIQIINFLDIKNHVSPVGKIEIYQGKKLIFKGILNSNKINNIEIDNNNSSNELNDEYKIRDYNDTNELSDFNNNNNDNDSYDNYTNDKNRPYSLSKYRSIEEIDINYNRNKFKMYNAYDNYYTTRIPTGKKYNNLIKNYSNDKILFNNDDIVENEDLNESIKNNNINTNIDNILSQKLSWEFTKNNKLNNIIFSSQKNNNTKDFDTYNSNDNSNNKLTNSNSNDNINKGQRANITLNNNKDINNTFFNIFRKNYNKNDINDVNQIFRTSFNKLKDYSSFNLKKNKKDIIKEKIDNSINNKDNNEFDEIDKNENNENNNINDNIDFNDSFNELNFINDNINNINNNIYTTIETPNFIEFNKIRFVITLNYGHPKYVGLTGIELFNVKYEQINIESALTIGALPKDLRTLYNDEKEQRIFENVFNKINNTNDSENMWVTRLKKNYPFPFIELYFKDKLRVSKIKIYNYNEKDKLNIGAKNIELYLDDKYYNTLNIKQGTGEIAFDFIKIPKNDNINTNTIKSKNDNTNENLYELDESDSIDNIDFGQDITFPLKENNISALKESESNINENSQKKTNSNNSSNIKYASFLYKQSYETPYLPYGSYLKLVLENNYYKGVAPKEESDLLKYNDIGFNKIEIFNEEGIVLNKADYKIISNCEIFHTEEEYKNDKIIINGAQNENGNNCLFYIFDKPKKISYIKFYPLEENNQPGLNSVKDIKIFSDCNIIFEGCLYLNKPTIILFTCEKKIINNIDEQYLTNEINERTCKEEKNDKYISLILN